MAAGRGTRGKGLIRSLNRKGTRTGKSDSVAGATPAPRDNTVCRACGAVFSRRTWRRGRRLSDPALARATWATCPACEQIARGEYSGRVIVRGDYLQANLTAIRQRIANVAARGETMQPEHRVVSVSAQNDTLEVLTTSQQLAHRIAHELKKAFGGRTSYAWSDRDGSLLATWERNTIRNRPGRAAG